MLWPRKHQFEYQWDSRGNKCLHCAETTPVLMPLFLPFPMWVCKNGKRFSLLDLVRLLVSGLVDCEYLSDDPLG